MNPETARCSAETPQGPWDSSAAGGAASTPSLSYDQMNGFIDFLPPWHNTSLLPNKRGINGSLSAPR